jgi:hypothetical protein
MKNKIIFLILLVLMIASVNAQDKKASTITIGINSGIDNNINAYRLTPNTFGNNFYSNRPQYNIGIDYGMMITEKFRPRVELKYVQLSYGAGWDDANISTLKESTVTLNNFDFNIHMDWLLISSSKFQIFVSPGLKWELNLNRTVKNIRISGSHNWANYNGIVSENSKNLLGGSLSTILKYNITDKIGITMTPEYTLFFRNFVRSNNELYQRVGVNFGLEFGF